MAPLTIHLLVSNRSTVMQEQPIPYCPDCENGPDASLAVDRRSFLQAVSGQAALAVGVVGLVNAGKSRAAVEAKPKQTRPAEELVKELFATLSAEQKRSVVLPF